MTEYCICGHNEVYHTLWEDDPPSSCLGYEVNILYYCECNQFKLDNLRLVEDLARNRGLI